MAISRDLIDYHSGVGGKLPLASSRRRPEIPMCRTAPSTTTTQPVKNYPAPLSTVPRLSQPGAAGSIESEKKAEDGALENSRH